MELCLFSELGHMKLKFFFIQFGISLIKRHTNIFSKSNEICPSIGGKMCRHTDKVALLDLGTFGHTWCNFHKHVALTKIKSIRISHSYDAKIAKICNFWISWPVFQLINILSDFEKMVY